MLSIIIPVYNTALNLSHYLLTAQSVKEIILVNDGSTDNTSEICRMYAQKYDFIKFIDKPHTGVSDTRNAGIRAAAGKYIMFLDADDELAKGSIEALTDFFDSCYDEVDLVTYPIETHWHGNVLPPHFRYKTMTYTGIYDMNIFPYIGQTTMNIVVKNKFRKNILFDTSMTFSEDQKYCCDVISEKMKIGFCSEAKYIYNRSEHSSSGKINGSCYIFEQSMKMFENIFTGYKSNVPAAMQGLYINDLEWKMRSNILYPVHYLKDEFKKAESRIERLLLRVDNSVILEHPGIDFFHKYYWLKKKTNSNIVSFFENGMFGLKCNNKIITKSEKIEVVVTRQRIDHDKFIFRGFLKSVVFNFSDKPDFYACVNNKKIKIDLYDSAHSYYLCHTKTNNFYAFCLEIPVCKVKNLSFLMCICGKEYKCTFYFMPRSPFSHKIKRYDAVLDGKHIHYDTNKGAFSLDNRSPYDVYEKNSENIMIPPELIGIRHKAAKLSVNEDICLYYDCRGVEKDNGYYRFINDFEFKDGWKRYYVYDRENNNIKKLFSLKHRKYLIPFGSIKHKIYMLAAKKIITAFIEDINFIPFPQEQFCYISDFFGFEVEYIQHGILHASMPWKYTPEIIMADKLCISTDYERRLFISKYNFRREDIIESIMPRLKALDRNIAPEKKILFAPSWRQYLIGANINGKWQTYDDLFLSSDYYNNISKFLLSETLDKFLEENGYKLEFKIHPIFECYLKYFHFDSENIKLITSDRAIEKYEIMITDFSSFLFDFLYLDRIVFSFIPDSLQFSSGMNSYYEIEPESREAVIDILNAEDFIRKFKENKIPEKKINFFD